ncbi:hypothetical protein RESH_03677 [Rhodopirellula europaea SH398]|uniref:Uncharacterized protein n=2 Tax=Rhodopirellula europaea TaxID=1263866 RepID=M5S2R9_9BACT|nr:hypothetical protein RE6C_02596 [Rhodopirellula europaea 6C]EMI25761.1 hypothetical protein RESH_03677 [Rhodopirellula europaea SH398]
MKTPLGDINLGIGWCFDSENGVSIRWNLHPSGAAVALPDEPLRRWSAW